ncbi:G-type lectin S-receptor-like serine/threonine-protein kinase At4g27290 [Solanum stenotomum]|uniref:G-type lectin S-receptor-like serine/threonine-protein kinase At4g27290 n=1 Tax=Solanum stenotomum TaxID=172797 RepID=UPI0020D10DF0|nr:G-type lectin S-receptor-like serine/threonine-protein kinase At4g27290 [Solanum stenotomum]
MIQLQGNALYTLILLESGYPQALVKRGTSVLGHSGPWNGLHWSGDHAPSSSQSSIYKIQFVLNKEEVFYNFYFISSLVLSRLVLTSNGYVQSLMYVNQTKSWLCLSLPPNTTYSLCGAYGSCDIDHSPGVLELDFHARTGLIQNEVISISQSFSREIL